MNTKLLQITMTLSFAASMILIGRYFTLKEQYKVKEEMRSEILIMLSTVIMMSANKN